MTAPAQSLARHLGDSFEAFVSDRLEGLRAARDLAWWRKVGPAVRWLRDGSVVPVGVAPCDYVAQTRDGGAAVVLEAKSIGAESLPQSKVAEHQRAQLNAAGACAWLAVEFRTADAPPFRALVPWAKLSAGFRFGMPRSSVTKAELAEWEWTRARRFGA